MTKMAKPIIAVVAAAVAAVITGCATVEYSSTGTLDNIKIKGARCAKDRQHVSITTSGYNMFWCLPLACGDIRWNSATDDINGGVAFFQDQVGLDELQTALQKIAESRDCDLANVYFNDSDGFYVDVSWGGLIGTCFGSSQMGVSAVLVPRTAKTK